MRRWFGTLAFALSVSAVALPSREMVLEPTPNSSVDVATLRASAQAGDGDAMALLGWAYRLGRQVPRDTKEGRRWLEAGRELGSLQATMMLGWALLEDESGDPDAVSRGLALLQTSAEAGAPWAQMAWGYCLAQGVGGRHRDLQAALPWLRAAADEPALPLAKWVLADALAQVAAERKEGAEAEEQEASQWFLAAAQEGVKQAATPLAARLEAGRGMAPDLKAAARWYRVGAEHGNAFAQFKLAYLLDNGLGVARDSAAARIWNEQAAAKDLVEAKLNLGYQHELGRGGPVDLVAARRWYEAAAEQGNGMAMTNLARLVLRPSKPSSEACRESRRWLEKAMKAGYADAYASMGHHHENGRCLEPNEDKARGLYQQGAERGSKDAMWYLARQLRRGGDAKPDALQQARGLLERCSALHDAECALLLARMQAGGEGAAPDLQAAERTLKPWGEQGHAAAQNLLGELLDDAGQHARALPWLQLGSGRGHAESKARLAWLTLHGLGVPRDEKEGNALLREALQQGSTLAQLMTHRRSCVGLNDTQLTAECVKELQLYVRLNNATAMVRLGKAYQLGLLGPDKPEDAFNLFRSAALRGDPEGQVRMAMALYEGYGIAPDATKAASWARKAAEQGNAEAQTVLGYLYEQGEGLARDLGQALHWYSKAAEQCYGLAFNNLAHLHEQGLGVPQDPAEARRLYRQAWQAGEAAALNRLALMLEQGLGGPADTAEALQLLRLSAARGDRWACQHLGRWLSEGRHGVRDEAEGQRLLAQAQATAQR